MLSDSLRIFPPDWLGPLPVELFHPRPNVPLELDLGAGKGRFLLARAAKHPESDFFGVDRMLRRIRKVDNRARRADLHNIRLLRAEGYYTVAHLLPTASVDICYVFFPDPWPKARHSANRIFNPAFITALQRILKPGGIIHIATDHAPYFELLTEIFQNDSRFIPTEPYIPAEDERTDFELHYIQQVPIGRLSLQRA